MSHASTLLVNTATVRADDADSVVPADASTVPANTAFAAHSLRRVLHAVMATDRSGVEAVLRLILALVMFPHGAQKLLGWFGGYGLNGTLEYFTGALGIPMLVGLAVIIVEFFGPLALVVGLLSRVVAVGIAGVMVGAVLTTHWQYGFFMNWGGTAAGEGFEYHLLMIGIAIAIMIRGSGALSLDRVFTRRVRSQS